MKYKLKNGKLYDGLGNLIELKIGDREQIDFLKKHMAIVQSFENEGYPLNVDIETTYTASTYFKCICGEYILHNEIEVESEDDWRELADETMTCFKCKKSYITSIDEDGDLVVKIKK